jgi:hypothetical protein
MFSKTEIMRKAWAIYKEVHATYADWQIERGIVDGSFSGALKTAWRVIKARVVQAARKAAEMANPAIVALRSRINALQFKSFGHNIQRERQALELQIAKLLKAGDVNGTFSLALGA